MENTDVIRSTSSSPPHQTDTKTLVDIESATKNEVNSVAFNNGKEIRNQLVEDDEIASKPTIEITSLILEKEQQAEEKKLVKEVVASVGKEPESTVDSEPETASKSFDETETSKSDTANNNPEDSTGQTNGSSSVNSGLQAILVNLCEVIQQQLTPLLESVQLPGINIALATNSNGTFNLSNLQQQLAVAQVATATQIQRTSHTANPNQQRLLNTASILASQLGAAACAAAAVASSEEQSSKLSSNSTTSISPSTSPSLTSSSSSVSWNNQQQQQQMNSQWHQQQQRSLPPQGANSAQVAAAAWTSALQNASANSAGQYQQKPNALQQLKTSSSKANNIGNSPTSSTMQQALNSIYSGSQQQHKSSPANANVQSQLKGNQGHNYYNAESGIHSQKNKSFEMIEDQDKTGLGGSSSGAFDLSMLNNQLIELIRQDPSQLEQILKLKLYQGGDDVNSLIEELQQLDQTVPANLAAAAAAVAAANNQNNRNSPRAAQNQHQNHHHNPHGNSNSQNYSSNYNLMQQQNLQMAQQHHSNMHGHNKPFMGNFNLNNFPHQHQSNQQQQFQVGQQFHPNFLQLALQQQQLSQFQDYHEERFSRKVFVGGLPPDIDEDEIVTHFRRYGNLIVDWPHKAESKSYFPPKGYAFLIFQDERSVQDLIETCVMDDGKLYMVVSSPSMKDKPVQIRPWCLNDSDFVMDGSQPLDPRKTIFVGGVPRPLKAIELAMIMDRFYGGVCYAGIDTDPELKYPKGAGRVAFSNQQSYIAAISARFVQLQHGEIDKRVEVKPYVLDDQMCDECQGARCGGKFAPFFCANVTCLQYYCEACWATIHTRQGREYHKPLVKEGADRPRPIPYK